MFTWFIDYVYAGLIIFIIVFSPFFIWLMLRKNLEFFIKAKVVFVALIFSFLMNILLLFLKDFHIDVIRNICFDWPLIEYKSKDIPSACYDFDNNKYMGIGWPLAAIFYTVVGFIYMLMIYILWVFADFYKHKNWRM